MPDHRVGGIDHLVGKQTGKPESRIEQRRSDNPVRCIFGQAFDCRAGYAIAVQCFRVTTHNHGDRLSPALETGASQTGCNIADMLGEAFLGEQDGNDQDFGHEAKRAEKGKDPRRKAAKQPCSNDKDGNGQHTRPFSCRR